jgi:hypothetical protein
LEFEAFEATDGGEGKQQGLIKLLNRYVKIKKGRE